MNKLVRKFKTEAKKSPGKTGFLVIVSVVGLVIWIRMASGWFSGGVAAAPESTQQAASQPVAVPVAKPTVQTKHTDSSLPAWQEVAEWIALDRLKRPAVLEEDMRNPFFISQHQQELLAAVEQNESEDNQEPVEPLLPKLAPADLGLTLQGTLVGPRVRVARINGRSYREQDFVVVESGGEGSDGQGSVGYTFAVSEIHKSHVILMRDEELYELRMERPQLANGYMKIRGSDR